MNQDLPSHNAIKECINKFILPYQYEIFTLITKAMIDELNINISNQFLDGSKLEANANKYKFVFKPTTYHKKLDIKIKILLNEMNINFSSDDLIKSFQLKEIICKVQKV